jgi:hypothetical protein
LVDNFIEEVEERVRSDRYRSMGRRIIPWAIGAFVLLLVVMGGIWAWQVWQNRQMNRTSETYAAAVDSLRAGDKAGAEAKFAEIAKSGPPAYKSIALMQQAALRLRDNKTTEAVALFDQAAKADSDPMLADAARLKSALALMDTASYAAIEERLKPLIGEKRPYRIAAREALGMAKLKAGQTAAARRDFVLLTLAQDVPDSIRQRAQGAITLIDGGTASSITAALKAQPVMPPMAAPAASQPGAPVAQPGAPR